MSTEQGPMLHLSTRCVNISDIFCPRISISCEKGSVKGNLTRDFQLLVFSHISFPHDSEYPIRTISNFFRKFANIF
jgi:hypothetical protein